MEESDADAAMREMMGFGSFGSNKRQKLNSGDQKRSKKPPTTSSNSMPLGKSRIQEDPSSSLSMIPSSSPPSGLSQRGSSVWIAAKLPNAVSMPDVTEISEIAQPELTITTTSNDTLDIDQPRPATPVATDPIPTTSQPQSASLSATADTFTPSKATASHFSSSDIRSDPTYWTSGNEKQNRGSEVGYTSPWTGVTLTRAELAQYGRGKREVQEDGSTVSVFFKPGFLATQEELWGRWENNKEVKATANVA